MPNGSEQLMTIGVFSRTSGLTPKALRLYARMGLLVPALVDRQTRYRYYAPAQLERAAEIRRLSAASVPLRKIGQLLHADREQRRAELQEHLHTITSRSQTTHNALTQLLRPEPEYAVREVQLASNSLVTLSQRLELSRLAVTIPMLYGELYAALASAGVEPNGPALSIRRRVAALATPTCTRADAESIRGWTHLEVGCFVTQAFQPARGCRVRARAFEGGRALSVALPGDHTQTAGAHRALARTCKERGLSAADQVLELYQVGPYDTADRTHWRTEVVWPVASR